MEYWRYNIKQNMVRISQWVLKHDEGPWEKGGWRYEQKYIVMVVMWKMFDTKKELFPKELQHDKSFWKKEENVEDY